MGSVVKGMDVLESSGLEFFLVSQYFVSDGEKLMERRLSFVRTTPTRRCCNICLLHSCLRAY